jgi:uncharacterized protein (UPF0335 family)
MTSDELLRKLGFPGNYSGYKQLVMAIERVEEDEDRILNVYHDVYDVIAGSTGAGAKSVEKNIRTLIKAAWRKEYTVRTFEEISGYPCPERPSTSEFLDVTSNYLRKTSRA